MMKKIMALALAVPLSVTIGCDAGLRPSGITKGQATTDLTIQFDDAAMRDSDVSEVTIELSAIGPSGGVNLERSATIAVVSGEETVATLLAVPNGKKKLNIELKDALGVPRGSQELEFLLNGLSTSQDVLTLDVAEISAGNQSSAGGRSGERSTRDITAEPVILDFTLNLTVVESGGTSDPISYYDVANWLHEDCVLCHNPERSSGQIDLSRFPFRLNGELVEGDFLNQRVIDSLTGAFGVSAMPRVSGLTAEESRWAADRIGIMNQWASSGFLAAAPERAGLVLNDFVGTVRVEMVRGGVDNVSKTPFVQDPKNPSLFSARAQLPQSAPDLALLVRFYNPQGKVIDEVKVDTPLAAGSKVILKHTIKVDRH